MLLKTPRSSLTALPLEAFLSFFFLNTTLYYLQTCADDVHGLIFHMNVQCVGRGVCVRMLRHVTFIEEMALKLHHPCLNFLCVLP